MSSHNLADIETRVLAFYEKAIGQAVLKTAADTRGDIAAFKIMIVQDEIVVKRITAEEFYK